MDVVQFQEKLREICELLCIAKRVTGHGVNSNYVEESGYVSTENSCNEKPQVCIIQNKGYHFLAGRDRYIGVTGPK